MELIEDMIDQVAEVHSKFGINYFHIGADEVFNIGSCKELKTIKIYNRNKFILSHITRTAKYIKEKHSVALLFILYY